MDLYTVENYVKPSNLEEIKEYAQGWTALAGGTWLFTETQPQVKTLVDLSGLNWSAIEISSDGLSIGATCIMSQLLNFPYPANWSSIKALKNAVHELASFKVQNVATVGGNLCLAIPAGTFAPAFAALNARYELISPQGDSSWIAASDFQTGIKKTMLQPGHLLRRIHIATEDLEWQTSYQRICVATAGLAISIVVVAYHPPTSRVRIAISGAVAAPVVLEFPEIPQIEQALTSLNLEFLDDSLASSTYRQQVTAVLLKRALLEATSTL